MRESYRVGRLLQAAARVSVLVSLAMGPACTPPPPVDPDSFHTTVAAPAVRSLDTLSALMAFGDLDVNADGRRFTGRIRALYVAPDTIRIDAELPGFFGLMGGAGTLWAAPGALWWSDGSGAELRTGVDPVFGKVLGRVPTARDLLVALFGLPAWWPGERPGESAGPATRVVELRGDPARGEIRLVWADGWTETGRLGGNPPVLRQLIGQDPRGTAVTTTFDSYKVLSDNQIPGRLGIRSPRTGGSMRVRWQRFDLDPPGAGGRLGWPWMGTRAPTGLYLPE